MPAHRLGQHLLEVPCPNTPSGWFSRSPRPNGRWSMAPTALRNTGDRHSNRTPQIARWPFPRADPGQTATGTRRPLSTQAGGLRIVRTRRLSSRPRDDAPCWLALDRPKPPGETSSDACSRRLSGKRLGRYLARLGSRPLLAIKATDGGWCNRPGAATVSDRARCLLRRWVGHITTWLLSPVAAPEAATGHVPALAAAKTCHLGWIASRMWTACSPTQSPTSRYAPRISAQVRMRDSSSPA